MSKTAPVLIVFLLVLGSCLAAGCSSIPFSGGPTTAETPRIQGNAGLAPAEVTVSIRRYAFDDILADLAGRNLDTAVNRGFTESSGVNVSPSNGTADNQIKQVHGSNLDEYGNAVSWTFVIQHGDKFSIVSYGREGMSLETSPGTLPQPAIDTSQIISPGVLFERNRDLITNTTRTGPVVTRDISLGGGIYTITISGRGTPRILTYDAKTGALISTND